MDSLTDVIDDICKEAHWIPRETILRGLTGVYVDYDRNEIYKAQFEIRYQLVALGYIRPTEWPRVPGNDPHSAEYSELEPVIVARAAYLLKVLNNG